MGEESIVTLDSFTMSSLGAHMIFEDIDEVSSLKTCEFLLKANMVLDGENPITMFINSGGGSVTDGWAIIDVMNTSHIEIQTVAIGLIASMATLIFTAGTPGRRIMTPNTAIMTHQFSSAMYGKEHELIATRKFHDNLSTQIIQHFLTHSKMNEKQIRDILLRESDTWLEPKECLKYGLCDKISNPWEKPAHNMKPVQKPKALKAIKAVKTEKATKSKANNVYPFKKAG
jgi:ATP-dependent Clp protease protease subunit